MAGRLFAGFTVVFWLAMMTALVRVEFFPQSLPMDVVPIEPVLRKILSQQEPARLSVYYQGERVGTCKVGVLPLAARDASPSEWFGLEPGAYQVCPDVALNLVVLGIPSKLRVKGCAIVDARFELAEFKFKTVLGDSVMEIRGDDRTRKIEISYDDGDFRQFDFGEMGLPDLLESLGLPGPIGPRRGAAPSSVTDGNAGSRRPMARPITRTYHDDLVIAGKSQRANLIVSRLGERVWVKVWVDDKGRVLLVDTPLGVTMRSELIDDLDGTHKAVAAHRRYEPRTPEP